MKRDLVRTAKPTTPAVKPAPQNPTLRKLGEVSEFLQELGITEWTAKVKNGSTTFVGKADDGTITRFSNYSGNGFTERTVSKCVPLTPSERQEEARRLSRQKLTQIDIAERLGVSQKTISNDLRD